MNASAPGWQPDPTGRHEYRYWDGGTWTDDVSDAGLTSLDPAPGLAAARRPARRPPASTPRSWTPLRASPRRPPTAPRARRPVRAATRRPTPVPGPAGTAPRPATRPTAAAPLRPAKPPRSGPSTGLLVGLGAVALALIVAIVVVLTGGDDGDGDETSTSDTTESSVTTDADSDTPDTTVADDTTDTSIDLGSSDIDFDDPEVRAAIIDVVADQLEGSGFTREQAECFTGAMLDGLGPDRLAEIGASGGDMSSLTPEDMSSIFDAVADCGITDIPTGGEG